MSVYFIVYICGEPVFLSFCYSHSYSHFSLCLSGPCLFTSSSSSLSTLSPVGPDSPLKCFAKAGKMEPNQLFNGFGPFQPAVAVHWSLQHTQYCILLNLYFWCVCVCARECENVIECKIRHWVRKVVVYVFVHIYVCVSDSWCTSDQ